MMKEIFAFWWYTSFLNGQCANRLCSVCELCLWPGVSWKTLSSPSSSKDRVVTSTTLSMLRIIQRRGNPTSVWRVKTELLMDHLRRLGNPRSQVMKEARLAMKDINLSLPLEIMSEGDAEPYDGERIQDRHSERLENQTPADDLQHPVISVVDFSELNLMVEGAYSRRLCYPGDDDNTDTTTLPGGSKRPQQTPPSNLDGPYNCDSTISTRTLPEPGFDTVNMVNHASSSSLPSNDSTCQIYSNVHIDEQQTIILSNADHNNYCLTPATIDSSSGYDATCSGYDFSPSEIENTSLGYEVIVTGFGIDSSEFETTSAQCQSKSPGCDIISPTTHDVAPSECRQDNIEVMKTTVEPESLYTTSSSSNNMQREIEAGIQFVKIGESTESLSRSNPSHRTLLPHFTQTERVAEPHLLPHNVEILANETQQTQNYYVGNIFNCNGSTSGTLAETVSPKLLPQGNIPFTFNQGDKAWISSIDDPQTAAADAQDDSVCHTSCSNSTNYTTPGSLVQTPYSRSSNIDSTRGIVTSSSSYTTHESNIEGSCVPQKISFDQRKITGTSNIIQSLPNQRKTTSGYRYAPEDRHKETSSREPLVLPSLKLTTPEAPSWNGSFEEGADDFTNRQTVLQNPENILLFPSNQPPVEFQSTIDDDRNLFDQIQKDNLEFRQTHHSQRYVADYSVDTQHVSTVNSYQNSVSIQIPETTEESVDRNEKIHLDYLSSVELGSVTSNEMGPVYSTELGSVSSFELGSRSLAHPLLPRERCEGNSFSSDNSASCELGLGDTPERIRFVTESTSTAWGSLELETLFSNSTPSSNAYPHPMCDTDEKKSISVLNYNEQLVATKRMSPSCSEDDVRSKDAKSRKISDASDSSEDHSDVDATNPSGKKERNRIAAQKFRQKQLVKAESLENQRDALMNKQERIKQEIERLEMEKEDLKNMLRFHQPMCQFKK